MNNLYQKINYICKKKKKQTLYFMKRIYFLFYFILFFVIMILFLGCAKEPSCDGVQKEPEIILDSIIKSGQNAYPSIRRIKVNNSIKLVNKNQDGLFLMPLDLSNDQTQYIIEFNNGDEYTLTLTYTRRVLNEYRRCGFRMIVDKINQSIPQSSVGVLYTPYYPSRMNLSVLNNVPYIEGMSMKIKIN